MTPRLSVVVPTYRRPHLLRRCLEALLSQDLPAEDYEIIVVDDGCNEETQALVARLAATCPGAVPDLFCVSMGKNRGPAAARNRGWRCARGEIIAFTDDDCVPMPDWLSSGLAAFNGKIEAAWGAIVVPLPLKPTDYELDASRLQSSDFATANCFCQRRVLEQVGGLDENFTAAWREDSDLYFTLLEHGARVVRIAEAVVTHPVRPARWGISVLQQRKILFDALLYKKHPERYRRCFRAAASRRYYLILAAMLACLLAAAGGQQELALLAAVVWAVLTARLCLARLHGTRLSLVHIAEMAVTSALIPPLAVFWRLFGAIKFRTVFF